MPFFIFTKEAVGNFIFCEVKCKANILNFNPKLKFNPIRPGRRKGAESVGVLKLISNN